MTIKVPGKLMVAGEFAVLVPYQNLVVMAVDRFVYTTWQPSDQNRITFQDFNLNDLMWDYKRDKVNIHSTDKRVHFVENAMTIAFRYLQENGITPNPFELSIKSELDDTSGIKYGLGSSAAVVTSVITAILKGHLPEAPTATLIFKLAAITHVNTQGNGSGADVAASSYGGILHYSSFQAEWLKTAFDEAETLTALLKAEWTYLSINPIQIPENVYICVGWTGNPASTGKLVDRILHLNKINSMLFEEFLTSSEEAVKNILMGMESENIPLLLEGVKQNRQALAKVGRHADTPVETPLLSTLCDLAEQYGGAGKPSGAGGGDCGIAFMPSKEKADALMKAWSKAGIKPLDIQPNPFGASAIEE